MGDESYKRMFHSRYLNRGGIMVLLNPYLDAWRKSSLDTATALAVKNGENMLVWDNYGNSVVANASTNVASVYDEWLKQNGYLSPTAGAGGYQTQGNGIPWLLLGALAFLALGGLK